MTHHEVPHEPPAPESESPEVPGFRTWRGVYLAVLGSFVVIVVLLTAFTRMFR